MNQKRVLEIFCLTFRSLPKRDRERLAHHYHAKTEILCGKDAASYADGRGAG